MHAQPSDSWEESHRVARNGVARCTNSLELVVARGDSLEALVHAQRVEGIGCGHHAAHQVGVARTTHQLYLTTLNTPVAWQKDKVKDTTQRQECLENRHT